MWRRCAAGVAGKGRQKEPPPPKKKTLQAAWLYRATGEEQFLAAARKYLQRAQVRVLGERESIAQCCTIDCGYPSPAASCMLAARHPCTSPQLPHPFTPSPHPTPSTHPRQYQRNYFVSWDSVFVPADILLSSLGVGPSPGVDHAWQIAAFLDTWQKGGLSCWRVVPVLGLAIRSSAGDGKCNAPFIGGGALTLPPLSSLQATTASSSAPRAWRWRPSAAGATCATGR